MPKEDRGPFANHAVDQGNNAAGGPGTQAAAMEMQALKRNLK